MIKFPTTIGEYTEGKLWYEGVDESIARRILVDLSKIEDERELDLRKMYLAHYYCQIGEYKFAMTIGKEFMLENKLIDDTAALMKRIFMETGDVESFSHLAVLVNKMFKGKLLSNLAYDADKFEMHPVVFGDKDTDKGQIIYESNIANYYQNGVLVFSVEDKNYNAYISDSVANLLLAEERPEEAIECLMKVDMSKLKVGTQIVCNQTLVRAYYTLERFDEAYESCVLLMQNDVYVPEMAEIAARLHKAGSKKFDVMKEFLLNYNHYSGIQLGDVHSLAHEIGDGSFWQKIYENNHIDPSDISEDTYIFKGILAFNNQDYQSADRLFKQAHSIYGHYGKSRLYSYYLNCYTKKLKKNAVVTDMPCEMYTARIDDIYDFIDKKLLSKLKKCLSKEDFVKRVDDNMLELDNMLSGVSAKSCDVVNIVNRVYQFDYLPACDLIKKIAVDSEYNFFIRSVCLANYMMCGGNKKIIIGSFVYDNPFVEIFKIDGNEDKQPFLYGIALYLAFFILSGLDSDGIKEDCDILKSIFSISIGDYTQISPLAVFGSLFAFMTEDEVHYDKAIVKKREVKAFARTYLDGLREVHKYDEEVVDFIHFCYSIARKK